MNIEKYQAAPLIDFHSTWNKCRETNNTVSYVSSNKIFYIVITAYAIHQW